MKRFDANHSRVQIDIRFHKTAHQMRRNVPATRKRNVRMPRTQIRFQTDGDSGVADALVQLEQVRMSTTNADPNNVRQTFWRERPHARNRKKKGAKCDRAEFFAECKIDIFRDRPKKTESEMHLLRRSPANTANVRIKIDKEVFD